MLGTALRKGYQQWHLCRAESSWKEPSTAACSCLGMTACLQALCKVLSLCWKPGILKTDCLNPVLFALACWIVVCNSKPEFLLDPALCKALCCSGALWERRPWVREVLKAFVSSYAFWPPLPVRVRLHVFFLGKWGCWYKILPFATSLVVLMVLVCRATLYLE